MSGNIQKFSFENSSSNIQNNINSSLLWQYNNAPILTSLVNQKAQWYAERYSTFWSDWYHNVFNLYTATAFGLAVWTIILNLPIRIDEQEDEPDKPVFGFGPDVGSWALGYGLNYENSNFSNITTPQLTLEEKRFLLQLRYFQLQSRGAMLEINKFLPTIIGGINGGSGTLFVFDNLNMTITYTFTFTPRPALVTALTRFDVLPRPAGVKAIIVVP